MIRLSFNHGANDLAKARICTHFSVKIMQLGMFGTPSGEGKTELSEASYNFPDEDAKSNRLKLRLLGSDRG
jgi:hypothetical protein